MIELASDCFLVGCFGLIETVQGSIREHQVPQINRGVWIQAVCFEFFGGLRLFVSSHHSVKESQVAKGR